MTQPELAELLGILQELQRLGWPVEVWPPSPLVWLDSRIWPGRWVEWNEQRPWRFEAEVRDWLKRQIDARGLWIPFLRKIGELVLAELDARGEPGDVSPNERRSTLLEVARAALVVAKEMKEWPGAKSTRF